MRDKSGFGDWDIQEAHSGSSLTWPFRTWELTRPLPGEVHDICCRPTPKALRPKDEADFDSVLLYLNTARRHWLQQALQIVQPGHPWLGQIRG